MAQTWCYTARSLHTKCSLSDKPRAHIRSSSLLSVVPCFLYTGSLHSWTSPFLPWISLHLLPALQPTLTQLLWAHSVSLQRVSMMSPCLTSSYLWGLGFNLILVTLILITRLPGSPIYYCAELCTLSHLIHVLWLLLLLTDLPSPTYIKPIECLACHDCSVDICLIAKWRIAYSWAYSPAWARVSVRPGSLTV